MSPEAAERLLRGEKVDLRPPEEQPVGLYRVVSLVDLLREGPGATAHAVFDLATSDHEWIISTRIGDEAQSIYADTLRRSSNGDREG